MNEKNWNKLDYFELKKLHKSGMSLSIPFINCFVETPLVKQEFSNHSCRLPFRRFCRLCRHFLQKPQNYDVFFAWVSKKKIQYCRNSNYLTLHKVGTFAKIPKKLPNQASLFYQRVFCGNLPKMSFLPFLSIYSWKENYR